MSDEPRGVGQSLPLPGSPLAALTARIAAQLEAGAIPCSCPHPADVEWLYIPAMILCCADCAPALIAPHNQDPAHRCAICGRLATMNAAWTTGSLHAVARICEACSTAGNAPASIN